jgi:uncharacterized protein YkwD
MRSFRKLLAAVTVLAALVVPSTASAGERSILTAADTIESPIAQRINEIRRSHGLGALAVSVKLVHAADAHSTSMANGGYFSHTSADGTIFWKRIARYYPRTTRRWTVGENLLWYSGDVSPERAVQMWMNSPGHRDVILGRNWKQIGLSAVHVTNAGGAFGGRDVTIVTADFGAR